MPSLIISNCFTMYILLLFINVLSPQAKKKKKKKKKKKGVLREMRRYILPLSEKTTSHFPKIAPTYFNIVLSLSGFEKPLTRK